MRKRDLERFRETLLDQKMQIVAHSRQMLDGEAHVDSDALPDEIDVAVSESSHWLTGRMREREFRLLTKIEKSLEKIERGDYGECESCGEEIGLGRV